MRMSLIHNVAPYGGDEITSKFALSRRDKIIRPWPKNKCVVCAPNLSKKADDRERDTARGGARHRLRRTGTAHAARPGRGAARTRLETARSDD